MVLIPFVLFILLNILLIPVEEATGTRGFGPGVQRWGYVDVRPGAHMFWWLYHVNPRLGGHSKNINPYERPLLIWLQGGPGGSSTGIGNFQELGPLDVDGNARNYTWVQDYNVLFIDNPVGTGFSYVDDVSLLTTTNREISADLLKCIEGFLKASPKFQNVDIYILSQSYGGKMAAELALNWHKAQKAGKIRSHLKGVGLGDAWISPLDTVKSWPSFLFSLGVVDTPGKEAVEEAVKQVIIAADQGAWSNATEYFFQTQDLIDKLTHKVSFYNILHETSLEEKKQAPLLKDLMNNKVAPALGIQPIWGKQVDKVFDHLDQDFLKDVNHIVKKLIAKTDLKIFVYNGQLDLIVATPGTVTWVEKLIDKDEWESTPKEPLIVDSVVQGLSKKLGQFEMYWIFRAGHNVPRENPVATKEMLRRVIGD